MTIKQQGGVFGRNPTFNDAEIANDLSVGNDATVANDLMVVGSLTVGSSGLIDNLKVIEDLELRMSKTEFGSNAGYGYIFKTGSTGSAPFNQTGALVYQPRTSTTDGRSNHKFYTGDPLTLALDLKPNQNAHFGGNVVLPSGNGIDFSATAGTGTSELFDDYEEGLAGGITLSPETSGSFTMNAALDTLAYTKVGRLVSITGMISCTNVSAVGTFVELDGLPFAAADLSETAGRFVGMAQFDGTSGKPSVVGLGLEGWTKIRFPIDASTVTGNIYVNINYIAA